MLLLLTLYLHGYINARFYSIISLDAKNFEEGGCYELEFLLITKFKERYHPISNKNIHVWKIMFYKRKMKMIGKST